MRVRLSVYTAEEDKRFTCFNNLFRESKTEVFTYLKIRQCTTKHRSEPIITTVKAK
jgi:hypothetical protein